MSERINEAVFTVLTMLLLIVAILGFTISTVGLATTIYFIWTIIGGTI